MKILRDDGEGVPGDADDGVEIDLVGGDDGGGGEEDDDDVEDHNPEGDDAEVDVGAKEGDVEDGDIYAGPVFIVIKFLANGRTSAAYPHVPLCQDILLAPDASSDHQGYMWS